MAGLPNVSRFTVDVLMNEAQLGHIDDDKTIFNML